MSVVPKRLPEITKDDKTYPIALWMFNPEILCIVNYDHKDKKISFKQAKALPNRVCFEMNDFRHKGVVHCEDRVYFGTITYDKNRKLKLIKTNKGILYYVG